MRELCSLILALFVFATSSAVVSAEKGIVAYCEGDSYLPKMGAIVFFTNNGYSCGRIISNFPRYTRRGDYVAGKLNMYGFQSIYDIDSDEEFSVMIEEIWLNREQAMDWIERH